MTPSMKMNQLYVIFAKKKLKQKKKQKVANYC